MSDRSASPSQDVACVMAITPTGAPDSIGGAPVSVVMTLVMVDEDGERAATAAMAAEGCRTAVFVDSIDDALAGGSLQDFCHETFGAPAEYLRQIDDRKRFVQPH